MLKDAYGLPISTSSVVAAAALDRTVKSYLGARLDTRDHLAAMLQADPEFGLAHCLKGSLPLFLCNRAMLPVATEAAEAARRLTEKATPRERMHSAALDAWVGGDVDRACSIWEQILAEHPTDMLAFRFAHYHYFWTGRARDMLASADRIAPKWDPALPGYGAMLGCRSFTLEECGDYPAAEGVGRKAIEIDPADLWAAHAVAHVMEMQGRQREGIDWLEGLARHWAGTNPLNHHLWWHRALFHYEERDFDQVLALYDQRFRNLSAPLIQALPDFAVDIQNAASILFRLERLGVDIDDRWVEIADKAEQRIGDCASPFTLPHWMMALAATNRTDATQHLLDGMRGYAGGNQASADVVHQIAVPITEAVLAHRRGDYAAALDLMRPVIAETQRLGGSHAQHDVLRQLFLDCAMRCWQTDDISLVLGLASRHYGTVEKRVGYAKAAQQFQH